MRYRYLLCDNDNTLMDFNAAEHGAVTQVLRDFDLPWDEKTYHTYHVINKALWEAHERGEITQPALKVERFARLLTALGRTDVDAEALSDAFAQQLSTRADLMPDAVAFLTALHGPMRIALVSNGVGATQRGRLARCPFTPLLDAVLISGEVGISKPDPRLIDMALDALGCTDKREAILLGDSATADVAAACAAGIDSIHLTSGDISPRATYGVRSLREALALLQGL